MIEKMLTEKMVKVFDTEQIWPGHFIMFAEYGKELVDDTVVDVGSGPINAIVTEVTENELRVIDCEKKETVISLSDLLPGKYNAPPKYKIVRMKDHIL